MSNVAASLTRRDLCLVACFAAAVFGVSLFSGRPLTRHEAVLPETAREMWADGDWIVPKNGGRPWLESPPLPQWITVSVASVFGRCDEVWIVRTAPTLVGVGVVCLAAWMASVWFGRTVGLLAGLVTATIQEIARYAWLAEDEIFLCGLVALAMALFVRNEFAAPPDLRRSFWGTRPWGVWAFFAVLGATNLAKGVLFGMVLTAAPIAAFLFWNMDLGRMRRYVWLWGWLTTLAVGVAWPLAVYQRYPDVTEVWFFDQMGRVGGQYEALTRPLWYYLLKLPEVVAPWSILAVVGLGLSRRAALFGRYSPQRFLWCWAIVPVVILSIPHGKHHHYLLHFLVPWGVLAATALVWLRERLLAWPLRQRVPVFTFALLGIPACAALWLLGHKLHGPAWLPWALGPILAVATAAVPWGVLQPRGAVAGATLFGTLLASYWFGHIYAGRYADKYRFDAAFYQRLPQHLPPQRTALVDGSMGQLDAFHPLFYLRDRGQTLHNLSFLLDERLTGADAYVLTYQSYREKLERYGTVEPLASSEKSWRDGVTNDPITLYRLSFAPNLVRFPGQVRISPMQAMRYAKGPYLGVHR